MLIWDARFAGVILAKLDTLNTITPHTITPNGVTITVNGAPNKTFPNTLEKTIVPKMLSGNAIR